MVKTKKNIVHSTLVVTGYILFSLLVVATLISTTIPFGMMFFETHVMRLNVAVIAIALTVGAILPALLGYIIGDHSVKSKSKMSHHFNGVLFGLLGFWFMIISSVLITIPEGQFTDVKARMLLLNLLPGIGVAIVTTFFAIAHVRSNQATQDILEYKPFSVALLALIVALPLWSLINNIVTNTVSLYSFVSPAIIAVLGLISYASLRKTRLSKYKKIVWSGVSVSMAFVAYYAVSIFVGTIATYLQSMPTMEEQAAVSIVGLVLALVVWGVYWGKQAKSLRSK